MSSTHNHWFSHHHYEAWCHQIFFVINTKIFVTSSVLKLQKWFLQPNGVESNQKSKYDMYKLLGGAWATKRCAQDGFWTDIAIWLAWTSWPTVHCCTIIYFSSIKGQRPPTKHGQWLCMFDINWEFANISLISVGSAAVLAPHLSIVSTSALPSSDFRPYATPTHKWFCIYIFTQLSRFVLKKPKDFIAKLREREGQRVDLGRSLKGHL